jgi:hypothetical protein
VTERGPGGLRPSPPENGAAATTRELPVVFEGGACRPADGHPADGVLSFGPSGVGGFVRLGIGPLEPARAVR